MLAPQLPLTNRPVNRRTSSHTCTRSTCRDTEVYTHFQAAPQIAPRTQTYAYTKGVNVGLGTLETLSAWFGAGAAICRLGRNFLTSQNTFLSMSSQQRHNQFLDSAPSGDNCHTAECTAMSRRILLFSPHLGSLNSSTIP